MKLKILILFIIIPSMAFATPDFFNRILSTLSSASEEGAKIPAEYLQIINSAAASAGVELSQQEKKSIHLLMSYQAEENGITFNDMKIRTVVTQILMLMGERSGSFSEESRAKEIRIFQNILTILSDKRLHDHELYWWPFIFLNYSLPIYSEDEMITIDQNLNLLEELLQNSSGEEALVERLAAAHAQKKTATYYLSLGHRGLANMSRLSQSSFNKVIKYLDSVFEEEAASKGVSKVGTVVSSARASLQEMDPKDKAVGVAKIAATTPFVGLKLRILIWVGTMSYEKFDKMTGVQKVVAKTGWKTFLKQNPKVSTGIDTAAQVGGAASNAGKKTIGGIQRKGRKALVAGLELNRGSLFTLPGSLVQRVWRSKVSCQKVLNSH